MLTDERPRCHAAAPALLLLAAAAAAIALLLHPAIAMPPSAVQSTAASSLRSTAAPSLSASLWSDPAVQRVVSACESNGFVRALEAGSLPLQAFQGFLSQDKFFLGAFSRAYALARDKSSAAGDAASAAEFGDLLAGVENELSLHAGYAARWGVDMSLVRPVPACSEYTSFLLAVAEKEGVAACAAAMATRARARRALRAAPPGAFSEPAGRCRACASTRS